MTRYVVEPTLTFKTWATVPGLHAVSDVAAQVGLATLSIRGLATGTWNWLAVPAVPA